MLPSCLNWLSIHSLDFQYIFEYRVSHSLLSCVFVLSAFLGVIDSDSTIHLGNNQSCVETKGIELDDCADLNLPRKTELFHLEMLKKFRMQWKIAGR